MKRYLLLAIQQHYPAGGLNDYTASYDRVEDIVADIRRMDATGWDGLDRQSTDYAIKTAYYYDVIDTQTFCHLYVSCYDTDQLLEFGLRAALPAYRP